MAVRYEGDDNEPDLELVDTVIPKASKQPNIGRVSVLLRWHTQDPVDDYERHRNSVIFGFQHNRNPFIDHPEFVAKIWH
jgi:endonuclease I